MIDDQGIVFSEAAQELFALNTSATYIWCRLEDGLGPAGVAAALARDFGIGRARADAFLAGVLSQWRALGLLRGGPRQRPGPRPADEDTAPAGDAAPEPRKIVARRRYRLLGSRFRLDFTAPGQEAWVHPVLGHLEDRGRGRADAVFRVDAHGGAQTVYRDGAEAGRCRSLRAVAPLVKGLVLQTAINRSRYFAYIHAGVVSDGRRCLLLPAQAGGGKTTLSAGLVHAGFGYFSDEVALLERPAMRVRPVPLCFCVKTPGLPVLAPYYPEIAELPTHHREDGKLVRYLRPPADIGAPHPRRSLPVTRIVFPRFHPRARTRLEPLSRVEALGRLMGQCLALPVSLDRENVGELVRWIRRVDCYALPMSSLETAVGLITDLVREDRPAR